MYVPTSHISTDNYFVGKATCPGDYYYVLKDFAFILIPFFSINIDILHIRHCIPSVINMLPYYNMRAVAIYLHISISILESRIR